MGERGVYDHEIIKSYRDGIEQEVIFYCQQLYTFEILSYPLVESLKSQDSFWYYYSDDYKSRIYFLKYFNKYEYLVYNFDMESNRNLIVQESKKGINIENNFVTKINKDSPTILGSDNSDKNLFIGYSKLDNIGDNGFNLSIYDIESNSILDKMYLNLSQHPILTAGERAINRIKAINDSVYISVIAGTIIKFEVKDYELSVNNEFTDYYLFPNPTNGEVIYNFINPVSGIINWKLVDVNGIEILSKAEYFNEGQNTLKLNISHLSNGVYFLKFGNNTSKIILEK